MFQIVTKQFAPVALGLAALTATPASATTVYESATYTGNDTGEYIVQNDRWIGAVFTLDQTTQITGIGAQFGGFPSGTIFGAIASVDALTSHAPSDLEDIALAHTVFSVPTAKAVDLLTPLSVTLAAGNYAVIFGSGAFGASGWAGLGDLNTTIGSPTLIQTLFDDSWQPQSARGLRLFVEGNAVPEPATWTLMLAGFGLLGCTLRKRRQADARLA